MSLKLGTQTASLTNHLYSRMTKGQPEPEVGMGATVLCWTDRLPATIVWVGALRGRPFLTVQQDTATRTDKNGMSESQSYDYAPNPDGRCWRFSQTKDGAWREVTLNNRANYVFADGAGLRIGEREKYRDFSF